MVKVGYSGQGGLLWSRWVILVKVVIVVKVGYSGQGGL